MGIIVNFVLSMLYRSADNSNTSPDWAQGTVAYGAPARYLVYFFWLCAVGFFVLGCVEPPESRKDLIAGVCVLVAFCVMNLAMHLEFVWVSIKYDDDGIYTTSPWRRARSIPWSDISGVEFEPSYQWHVVKTKEQGNVRCHSLLNGHRRLLLELNKRGYRA